MNYSTSFVNIWKLRIHFHPKLSLISLSFWFQTYDERGRQSLLGC